MLDVLCKYVATAICVHFEEIKYRFSDFNSGTMPSKSITFIAKVYGDIA